MKKMTLMLNPNPKNRKARSPESQKEKKKMTMLMKDKKREAAEKMTPERIQIGKVEKEEWEEVLIALREAKVL